MPVCTRCYKEYGSGELTCPHCGQASIGLTGWTRYALNVGLILSILGVVGAILAGIAYLLHGHVLYALLSLFVGAPYSLAMATVFRHVRDRG